MRNALATAMWLGVWLKTRDTFRADSSRRVSSRRFEILWRDLRTHKRARAHSAHQAQELLAELRASSELSGPLVIRLLSRSKPGARSYVVEVVRAFGDVYQKY